MAKTAKVNEQATSAQSGFGSLAMLEQSLTDANQVLQAAPTEMQFSLDTLLNDVQTQIAAGAEVREDKRASSTRKIIEATFKSARENVQKAAQDLFQMIGNLDIFVKGFGIELSQLDKPTKDELARIAEAEAAIIEAGKKWFRKEKAIAEAKANLEQVQAQVAAAVRQRLMNTSTEQTLATFQLIVNNIVTRLETRISEITVQKNTVTGRKAVAIQIKAQAAKALEELREKKSAINAELTNAQDILTAMENGTADYVAQDKVVSGLKEQLDTVEGNLSIALALYQDKEIFVQRLEEHEKTQTKLLASHKTALTLLKSQTEERVVTWRSTLSAVQSANDQEIAKTLNDSGRKIDHMTDEMMAQVLVATERARIEKFEAFPSDLLDLVNICGATTEVANEFLARQEKMYEAMANGYGIDREQLQRFSGINKAA